MTGMPGMQHPPMEITGFTKSIAGDGKTMVLTLQRPLAPGSYAVTWHAVAADTHRIQGSFTFTVK
jgi:methionine-rich copper-binding protein CopC